MDLSTIFSTNIALFYWLLGIVGLIAIDVCLGISLAIKSETFSVDKLPQFINTKVSAYLIGLSVLVGAAQVDFTALLSQATLGAVTNIGFVGIAGTALGTYTIQLFNEIVKKINTLFGTNVVTNQVVNLSISGIDKTQVEQIKNIIS